MWRTASTRAMTLTACSCVRFSGTPTTSRPRRFRSRSRQVAIGLAVYVFRNSGSEWTYAVLGLIMGGTVGNGYERLVNGTVTDFINFHFWPVFNVADSAVSIGVVLMIAGYLLRKPSA